MSFFERLFGRRTAKQQKLLVDSLGKIRQDLESLRLPAAHMVAAESSSFSRLGGLPLVPSGFVWPKYKDKPLGFLCQIDLGDVPRLDSQVALPATGYLSFFYDATQSTWGFDPVDRGSWRVAYFDAPKSDLSPAALPIGLNQEAIYPAIPVRFESVLTYPPEDDPSVASIVGDRESDQYLELRESVYGDEPRHHLLGFADPVQSSCMEVECQLASNGVSIGNGHGYTDEHLEQLRSGGTDWILLLQVDSDEAANFMWGDLGMLYFWIKKSDLAARNFDEVWMVLQCS